VAGTAEATLFVFLSDWLGGFGLSRSFGGAGRLLLGARHRPQGGVGTGDVVAQGREPQGLGADAAGRVQDPHRPAPPLGADDAVERVRLALDAGVPVFVNQVEIRRQLAVGIDRPPSFPRQSLHQAKMREAPDARRPADPGSVPGER
jgi:hypothetical protein